MIVVTDCTCYKCEEYYVDDNKYIIKVGEKYYCMLCLQNESCFLGQIFVILCKNNYIDIVNKIIKYRIDLNIRFDIIWEFYITPLHVACEFSQDIAKILINNGVNIDAMDDSKKRPIDYCLKNGEVYNMLIKAGVKP